MNNDNEKNTVATRPVLLPNLQAPAKGLKVRSSIRAGAPKLSGETM